MIDSVLERKNLSLSAKITIKSAIGFAVIALAVALPQFVHLILGAPGGMTWLPMYLPVLIGGCILGWKYGVIVGMLSPVASFLITSAFSSPMPMLARLPFMVVELAVFGAVSGLFSKAIAKNALAAFPAVLIAEVCGRGVFMLCVVALQNVTALTPALVWSQIQSGFVGLFAQALLVPAIVIALRSLVLKSKADEENR